MSTKKATAPKAKKTKAATSVKSAPATAADTKAAAPEILYHCEVIKINDDGTLLKIGSMNCGVGARTTQPKSKADAMVEQGWVKILGIA